jgi:saccharopine dehydrogenase-like NADP-dependent oxidoreductase
MVNILLLGSGMMAVGVIDYMMRRQENKITIGTNIVS